MKSNSQVRNFQYNAGPNDSSPLRNAIYMTRLILFNTQWTIGNLVLVTELWSRPVTAVQSSILNRLGEVTDR